MMTDQQEANIYQPLFDLLSKEYNITLTISEMDEVINKSQKVTENFDGFLKSRELPCENCDTGDMKQIGFTSPNGTIKYECDTCSHEQSFP